MSQVFRVERTKNYTVMANYHLKDKRLSLKAKGLLSVMLSLPDDWNYNMKVLARPAGRYRVLGSGTSAGSGRTADSPTDRLTRSGESVDRRSQRRFSQYWRSQHYKRLMVLKNISIKYPSYQSLHSINNEKY